MNEIKTSKVYEFSYSASWMGEYSEADRDEREDPASAGRPQGPSKNQIWPKLQGKPSPFMNSTDLADFGESLIEKFSTFLGTLSWALGGWKAGETQVLYKKELCQSVYILFININQVNQINISETWSWRLKSKGFWRGKPWRGRNVQLLSKVDVTFVKGTIRRCLTSITRLRLWRSSGAGRSRSWPRSTFSYFLEIDKKKLNDIEKKGWTFHTFSKSIKKVNLFTLFRNRDKKVKLLILFQNR